LHFLSSLDPACAVMIMQQANMFPDILPFTGDPAAKVDGFADLRAALVKEL
jgi:hypothetical protein